VSNSPDNQPRNNAGYYENNRGAAPSFPPSFLLARAEATTLPDPLATTPLTLSLLILLIMCTFGTGTVSFGCGWFDR
jgi:hypothetical protein